MDWGGDSQFSDEEDDIDGDETTQETKANLDHILCLVDARKNMFEKNEEGQTYFGVAMKTIHRVLKTKVISSEKNMVGVTLFGTVNKTSQDSPHDHVFDLIPLDVPSAQGIKIADRLAAKSKPSSSFNDSQDDDGHDGEEGAGGSSASAGAELESFGGPLPPGGATPLKAALWSCTQQFIHGGQGAASSTASLLKAAKRVFLFTNDDDPLRDDPDEQDRAVQVARDAAESGVDIQLFGMASSDGCGFDVNKFYKRILAVDEEDAVPADRLTGTADFQALATNLHRKLHVKRTLARLPLILAAAPHTAASSEGDTQSQSSSSLSSAGAASLPSLSPLAVPTVSIQMQLVATTMPTKIATITLDGRSNEAVKPHTRMLCDDTGTYLDEYDVRTYQEVGAHGERAYITKQEMAQMKVWGVEPSITLLGFVSKEWLKPWYFVRSPYFLYPDESRVKGSTLASAALLEAMTTPREGNGSSSNNGNGKGDEGGPSGGLIGLARFVRTSSSAPVLMALVPQREVLDATDGAQVAPPGFHAVVLPFADDLRSLPPALATLVTPADAGRLSLAPVKENGDDDDDEGVDNDDEGVEKEVLGSGRESGEPATEAAAESAAPPATVVSAALFKAACELVGEPSVTFTRAQVQGIHNPCLQKQYHMLQALALDEDVEEEEGSWCESRDDDCRPDPTLWRRQQPKVASFLARLPEKAEKLTKRKAPAVKAEKKAKKPKADLEGDDDDGGPEIDWVALAASGGVAKQTVPNLKAFLKSKGLPVGGKKSDLVERALSVLSE